MGLFGNKYIRVVFQVERTGEKLGYSEMKASQIPESWKWETQVKVAGKEWDVAHVDPEHRKEMLKNGELRVYLRRADGGKNHEVKVPENETPIAEVPISYPIVVPIDPEMESQLGEDVVAERESAPIEPADPQSETTETEQTPETDGQASEEVPTLVPIEFTGIIEGEQEEEPADEQQPEIESQPPFPVAEPVSVTEPEPEPELRSPKPEFGPDEVALPWPTISGTLPETEAGEWGSEYFVIHEDLWRQIEWVDASREEDMNQTFRRINYMYEHHCFFRQGYRYFSELHPRTEWATPLSNRPSLDELRLDFFPGRTDFGGVVIQPGGRVVDGFAFKLESGLVLYGVAVENEVSRLALAGPDQLDAESLSLELDSMATLMRDYGWVLVDWLEQQRVEAETGSMRSFLLGE